MNKQNQIHRMSDNTLLDEVKSLVRREKEIVVEVIEYIKEIELRKLHLARGYSSMFSFATVFLGYSEAEAHIRIQAARLTQALPELKSLIETGTISLSVAAETQAHFRKENVRRKGQGKSALNLQEKREALELVSGSSRREAEQSLNIHFAQPSEKKLSFSVSPELEQKIEKLMDLMAHKNFDRDLGKMIEILVEQELAKNEKLIAAANKTLEEKEPNVPNTGGLKNGGTASKFSVLKRTRYLPRKTRTLIWKKYQGQCTYRDPLSGKKCDSKHGIQIDHKLAQARGGDHRPENLTLLCASHNIWKGVRQVE